MLYTVEEVAIKLNVSKQSIYNKLKLNGYKDKILIKQGKSMIDDDLLNLNKELIKTLLEQLNQKDIQIAELHNRLSQEQDNLKNMQVLQLRQQLTDILALEEHFWFCFYAYRSA